MIQTSSFWQIVSNFYPNMFKWFRTFLLIPIASERAVHLVEKFPISFNACNVKEMATITYGWDLEKITIHWEKANI